MAYNPLEDLAAAGADLTGVSDTQRQVFAQLTKQEVDTINSVKARLEAVSGDVESHTDVVGGVIF